MIDFAKSIPHTLGALPTWHQWGIGLVCLTMFASLWLPSPDALIPVDDPNRLPLHQLIPLPLTQKALAPNRSNAPSTPSEIQLDWQEFIIAQGDSLARLFEQAGLPASQLQQLTRLPQVNNALTRLQPKQVIRLAVADGQLQQLHYQISPAERLVIEATAQGFQSQRQQSQLQTRQRYAQATISSNFWNAASQAGLTANTIMQLARIFGWDVDFALDIRQGDRFAVLWQDNYLDGEYLSEGEILAAEFINGGQRFRAIRHSDGNYYSAEGEAMKKAFLRAPILFNYVSSNFNPRRLHPVTGLIRPHNGTDYVAPVGTPVMAAGDGVVTESSYNRLNGHYVVIKHANRYVTKYLHLAKRSVTKGQRVRQSQTIGTLGATGRVTGAHLHYECLIDGVHQNPRTVQLPEAEALTGTERALFLRYSAKLFSGINHRQAILQGQTITTL